MAWDGIPIPPAPGQPPRHSLATPVAQEASVQQGNDGRQEKNDLSEVHASGAGSPSSLFSIAAPAPDGAPEAVTSPARDLVSGTLEAGEPELVISDQRRQALLWTAPKTLITGAAPQHAMHFVIRVLKSWPRMMATHDPGLILPPVIHRAQLEYGMPKPLANCYTLVKMWAGQAVGSRELVQTTILLEVRRLLSDVSGRS